MSHKGPWESRVGMLLKGPEFPYAHKCPDIGEHGGQSKIDWLACDVKGTFWMIEVKWIQTIGTLFHVNKEVTPGQQGELNKVGNLCGNAYVAIGHGKTAKEHPKYTTGVYFVSWNWLRYRDIVNLKDCPHLFLPWKGETTFATEENRKALWLWPQP